MSRLFIHVGTHKTATTHVQDTFYQNRRVLRRHGIVFPRIGRTRGQHGLASAWIRLPAPYGIKDARGAWRRLAKAYGPTDTTVFVSSEELSRLRPAKVDMAELRALTDGFDEVRLICTLRNQASFLQSVYQQISIERNPGPWPRFFENALEATIVDGLALDYNVLHRQFRRGFDAREIRFLSYDKAVQDAGGIVGAVLRELDAPFGAEALAPFGAGRSNVSPSPLATFAANAVAAPRVAGQGLVRAMTESIDAVFGKERRTTVFSREELERCTERFRPLNDTLQDSIASEQPEFRMTSELDRGAQIFRGQLREDFWIEACRRLRADVPVQTL
ncbi:hypothetical protein [Rhodosalinus sp. K401]|uniref:hypothetical protein n=1 Tax=Rhodosalinus sp. K401 TaxID=3239195 RepID=UPI0035252636